MMKLKSYIIGIDEAGRGPLAGPVAVGAFAVRRKNILSRFRGVKESKQLSERQRNEWMKNIRLNCSNFDRRVNKMNNNADCAYVVTYSSAKYINKYGITASIRRALNGCLKKLEEKGFCDTSATILLDGSLHAPKQYSNQMTIIGGDAKEAIIALASICAKTGRDARMVKMSKKFPQYGFDIHKGYGTKAHYVAIKKWGVCDEHRLTFVH